MASPASARVLLAIAFSLLQFPRGWGQTANPLNNASVGGIAPPLFLMDTTINNMATHINLYPLTNQAGLAGSPSTLQAIQPAGQLFLTNPDSVNGLQPGNIAYVSCASEDYTGQIDRTKCINLAANNKPYAIVLYSTSTPACAFQPSGDFSYTSMYTMTDANSSSAVATSLNKGNPQSPQANIHVSGTPANNTNGNDQNVLGKSPTTAVAMIILYSITGIITALFLIIIIVGAIRAHRHPERYGPRHIRGRPRQSRAKGIARAMLETLPIVKFGDLEEQKKPDERRDVELAPTSAEHPQPAQFHPEQTSHDTDVQEPERLDGDGPYAVTTEPASGSAQPKVEGAEADGAVADDGLACSVCTDDFVKGQDIRVLPCKHKFHPECIDPWLLNVSGTCPLCRVDLQPTAPNSPTTDPSFEGTAPEMTPADAAAPVQDAANENTQHRNRRSRILSTLNIGRMRHATPDERIEALRRLRSEREATESDVGDIPITRFSQRISRVFGSRPTSVALGSRPASGALATSEGGALDYDPQRHGSFAGPTR